MPRNHDIITLDIPVLLDREASVMVENLKGKKVFLPKSQIEIDSDGIQLPEWLALGKELI